MSPHAISALPRHTHPVQDTDSVCMVCMEAMGGTVVVEMACRHRFHEACLVPWLERSGTCPVCRRAGEAASGEE
jgi:hypothetical protein